MRAGPWRNERVTHVGSPEQVFLPNGAAGTRTQDQRIKSPMLSSIELRPQSVRTGGTRLGNTTTRTSQAASIAMPRFRLAAWRSLPQAICP